MSELFHTLGVNLESLIFQGVNFAVLLIVLTIFIYRPLVHMMEERRRKIELGVRGGEEAARRIAEAEDLKARRIAEGERRAVAIIGDAEGQAQKRAREIIHGADQKADYLLKEAAATAQRRKEEELQQLMKEAQGIIKEALIKTVELNPKDVDEKLIQQALHEIHA